MIVLSKNLREKKEELWWQYGVKVKIHPMMKKRKKLPICEKNTSVKKKVFELQKELDEIKENFSKIEASKISFEKVNEKLLKKDE